LAANRDLRIAVVCGGTSAEAEVSRVSGRGVADALRSTYPNVVALELDANIVASLSDFAPTVVFPVLHGPPGEDGTFQGFLETLGLPYVGSGVRASACAMDKVVAKRLFRDAELPLARDVVVQKRAGVTESTDHIVATLGLSVVVKPSNQGSALGVAFPKNHEELATALDSAFTFDEQVLVEELVNGKEITVGVLEHAGSPRALPVVEIRTPTGTWYDFQHRYTAGLSDHVIPADLPADVYKRTQEIAVGAHTALGCRDLSRADFVVSAKGPILLEVNTLPGMTPTSLYPDAAKADGISFEQLVSLLVEQAASRSPAV
jgi:D-alanine-D-alanine ligase